MKWIYLIIAIITEVIATSALKESQGFSKIIPSIVVITGYSLTFYFMSLTLKEINPIYKEDYDSELGQIGVGY